MNKLILIGNLGGDPEMQYLPSGQAMTKFSVASNRKYTTGAGEQREETEWFNCSAWGKLAETCNQYLTKGQQIYVEGRLSSRQYQTQGGETRTSLDVSVTDIQFLGGKVEGQGRGVDESGPVDDMDIPF